MMITIKARAVRFRIVLIGLSVISLVACTFLIRREFDWLSLVNVFLIAALYNIPIHLAGDEISLAYIITLAGGVLYGPVISGWMATLGVGLGYGIRRLRLGKQGAEPIRLDTLYSLALQIIPLLLAFLITDWISGPMNPSGVVPQILFVALIQAILFVIFHFGLFCADSLLSQQQPGSLPYYNLMVVGVIEVFSVLYAVTALYTYQQIGVGIPFVLGIVLILLVVIANSILTARSDLERRLQELSMLNQISQVLRSSLDLEQLLSTIHQQVTQLLGVDNFYVALYNVSEQRIWYPLAVKHGKRFQWVPRPIMPDRLTDRVIQSGRPILLTPRTRSELERVGFPSSEETPKAWMGVPLITPERTSGCLAVFSTHPSTEFTQHDLTLLITLSGQVSVAIENAVLYEQANRRAEQLETLNRISTLITASLNPQEVFTQVCRSAAQVSRAEHSAIFLLDPEKRVVSLEQGFSLSESFTQKNNSFPVSNNNRMRCLRIGRPLLMSNLEISPLDPDYHDSLQKENIQAFGEFPLTTPDGRIGFLVVYFNEQHTFRPEEVELLQTFASQAALAVANARLYTNVDVALSRRAYQLSILETVGRELSAAIISERLFDLILNHAMEFTSSQWGEVSLYNAQNHTVTVKASRGYPVKSIVFSASEGITSRAIVNQQVVNVGDVRSDPDYIDLSEGASHSQLSVPLMHEGRVLGVLTLESDRYNAYTLNDQNFISQLTNQAAISVVNAELFSETQRRLHEQSILYLVSAHLVGNPGIDQVMQSLYRALEAALVEMSVGVYLWDERTSLYVAQFRMHTPDRSGCHLPEVIPFAELKAIQNELSKTGPLRISTERGRELLRYCPECQVLVFPMIANKQRLGMVVVHVAKERMVSDEELQLFKTIVAQVSLSLQNSMLFSDVTHGRDRMAAVLNSVGEGILMVESNGRIMLANEAIQNITGLPHKALLDNPFSSLPDGALRALGYTRSEAEGIMRSLDQGQIAPTPRMTIKSGEAKPDRVYERSTSPVWTQDGRVIGWMVVMRDITEQYQIDQARELITGTLVHDLRSPVSTSLSAIEIVQDTLAEQERHDEIIDQALRVAYNGATRVLSLIESLLDIARMQSGKMELNLGDLDMYLIANSLLNELAPQAKEYNITLKNDIPMGILPIRADQSKINRVVTNLLDNAMKFTPNGGQVKISAELTEKEEIAVRISDSGTGVPEEYRERIFEQFTQVPGQRARRRGSGLGLTFCRMAVEAHGGRIWVENRPAPDKGAVFTFTLPVGGPPQR